MYTIHVLADKFTDSFGTKNEAAQFTWGRSTKGPKIELTNVTGDSIFNKYIYSERTNITVKQTPNIKTEPPITISTFKFKINDNDNPDTITDWTSETSLTKNSDTEYEVVVPDDYLNRSDRFYLHVHAVDTVGNETDKLQEILFDGAPSLNWENPTRYSDIFQCFSFGRILIKTVKIVSSDNTYTFDRDDSEDLFWSASFREDRRESVYHGPYNNPPIFAKVSNLTAPQNDICDYIAYYGQNVLSATPKLLYSISWLSDTKGSLCIARNPSYKQSNFSNFPPWKVNFSQFNWTITVYTEYSDPEGEGHVVLNSTQGDKEVLFARYSMSGGGGYYGGGGSVQ